MKNEIEKFILKLTGNEKMELFNQILNIKFSNEDKHEVKQTYHALSRDEKCDYLVYMLNKITSDADIDITVEGNVYSFTTQPVVQINKFQKNKAVLNTFVKQTMDDATQIAYMILFHKSTIEHKKRCLIDAWGYIRSHNITIGVSA